VLAGAMVYVALAWGFSFLLIRQSVAATGPFGVALARAGIGAAILWLIPGSRRRVPLRDHLPLLLLALVWMTIPMVLSPSLKNISAPP
jgi:drug/metabolite transporter (DMT)-like permease